MGTSDQAMVSTAQTVKRPRQMRTNEEKRRIVEETLAPGISLASVAFKHGVNANLLFSWRRLHRRGLLEQSRESASWVPVTITPDVEEERAGACYSLRTIALGRTDSLLRRWTHRDRQ